MRIELPHVGESVTEGVIGKWLKRPGDRVEKYEPLVEVVTDKVTIEVPSPVSGILLEILAPEGVTLPMGAPLAEIETGDAEVLAKEKGPSPGITGVLVEEKGVSVGPTGSRVLEEPPPKEEARYSPVVRRLAHENNIDLSQVKGTGLGGRVTREDVLAYIEATKAKPAAPPSVQPAAAPDEEVIPLTPIRRLVAQNMVRSASQIPHAWASLDVDVTGLVIRREMVKEEFLGREGVPITYLPFMVKAVVESLRENPGLNSSWDNERIILKRRINIGIAVAAPQGLVVPVVREADRLTIADLAKAIEGLIQRARENKLSLGDVQGGTFTVNNTGVLGSVVSFPIINYPQAAILTTESIVKRPVVVNDAIAIRHMMNICLSFDHRIIDGAEALAFLQAVKRLAEAMGPDTPIY